LRRRAIPLSRARWTQFGFNGSYSIRSHYLCIRNRFTPQTIVGARHSKKANGKSSDVSSANNPPCRSLNMTAENSGATVRWRIDGVRNAIEQQKKQGFHAISAASFRRPPGVFARWREPFSADPPPRNDLLPTAFDTRPSRALRCLAAHGRLELLPHGDPDPRPLVLDRKLCGKAPIPHAAGIGSKHGTMLQARYRTSQNHLPVSRKQS
jgi:hypothetical protein